MVSKTLISLSFSFLPLLALNLLLKETLIPISPVCPDFPFWHLCLKLFQARAILALSTASLF